MKLHALCASAVALTLALISPAMAITKSDKDFAMLATVSWTVVAICESYEVVEGGPQKTADRNGVDFDSIGPAVVAAFQAQINQPYDRANLIPEVSIAVRDVLQELNQDFGQNKRKACSKWGEAVLPAGMIKRK